MARVQKPTLLQLWPSPTRPPHHHHNFLPIIHHQNEKGAGAEQAAENDLFMQEE